MFLSMYYCREPPCTTFWDRRWTWERSVRQFLPKISRSRYWMVHFLPNYCTVYLPACLPVSVWVLSSQPVQMPAILLTCMPVYLPSTFLLAYCLAFMNADLSSCCLSSFLPACPSVHMPDILPNYLPVNQLPISLSIYLPACLSAAY